MRSLICCYNRTMKSFLLLPPKKSCQKIDENLRQFFVLHKISYFNRALKILCRFYEVKDPQIEWYEYIDYGKTWGKTWSDGKIHLIHPKEWADKKRSVADWCTTFYHEIYHYLTFVDEENKADKFSALFLERATH